MKKIFFLSFFVCTALLGQNGLTSYPMPTGYQVSQVNRKTSIAIDNSNNIWTGFFYIGLGKFNGSAWTMFDMTNTPFDSDRISALAVQNGNIIWVSTYVNANTGGLFSYDGTNWTVYSVSTGNNLISSIVADNSGNVWCGTKNGLYKFNGLAWSTFTVASSGLASDTVLSLAIQAPSGNLLAGTERGLSVQNGTGWLNYTSANIGFPANNIKAVYSDLANGTWVSANGIAGRFSPPYFVKMDTIFLTPSVIYPTSCSSFARGPNAGVTFVGRNAALIEHTSKPEFYFYPFITQTALLAFNPNDGKTWIVNQVASSQGNPLFAFDGNYTHYLGEGNAATPKNCRYLDVNNVRTAILNRGDKSWNLNNAQYEVPKGGGAHTLFSSALWIGGLDNSGVLHLGAMTYRQSGGDFWPGPLDTISGNTDSLTCEQYDYVWRIDKLKIQEFQYYWLTGAVQSGVYIPDPDFLSWPAQGNGNYTRNMAPFVDTDGNGIYNPLTGGDYPLIKGDEMLYCIYNDNLAVHTEGEAIPLKVEVHASAYAFFCPALDDSQKVINYTTYYHYEIFNRSTNNYNNTYLGLFHDVDLGYFQDDYVGCISTENFSFVCNGAVNDGGSVQPAAGIYGAHPPISSIAVLNGPLAEPGDGIDNDNDGTTDEAGEKNLMTGHLYFHNDGSVIGNPIYADDFYNYMSSKWKDSTNLTYGGNGYGGITPTHFMFDGLMYDTAAWTEASEFNPYSDRRNMTSCGPFNLNAGQSVSLDYAIIFSRDTTVGPPDTLYYDQAVTDVRTIRNWFNTNSTPSCVQWGVGFNEPVNDASELFLYPNPASTSLTIAYKATSKNARYELLDLTGRVIASNTIAQENPTIISVETLPPGIYFVRIIDNEIVTAKKFAKQ